MTLSLSCSFDHDWKRILDCQVLARRLLSVYPCNYGLVYSLIYFEAGFLLILPVTRLTIIPTTTTKRTAVALYHMYDNAYRSWNRFLPTENKRKSEKYGTNSRYIFIANSQQYFQYQLKSRVPSQNKIWLTFILQLS